MRYVYGFLLSLPFVVSCSETEGIFETNDVPYWKRDLVIEATREGHESETRTIRQEDGAVYWNPADEISLFFMRGENGGYKFTSQNTEVTETAEFAGSISGITGGGENLTDNAYFWAIYPYSKENACENNSLITRISEEQQGLAETFADDTFVTVARSMNVKMGFYNVCGGLRFTVSQSGIKSVSFRGNNDEVLAGKVRVEFNESNIPVVTEILDGQKEITLVAPNGGEFEVGKLYYLVALPKALEGGFTMTFRKTDGTVGVYTRTTGVTLKRSIFGTVRNLDAGLTFYEEEESGETVTGGSESGFYLGIIGFNVDLYPYPIRKLTEESVAGFHSFIDGLSMLKGTLLYYAVDNSLDALLASTYPSNLYDVAVVTFTDGLDLISIDRVEIDKGIVYLSRDEYLEAIHTRLNEEKVSGQSITAYSIGVEGNDVTNSSLFQKNLEKIATSSDNAFKVTNMSEVAEKFTEIANQLGETKYVQTITLRASAPDNQERVRFTFDNVSSYSSSKLYIEGTFNRAANPRTLENITYVGLTSTSGSTITCPRDAQGFYEFTFEGIQADNGKLVPDDYQQRWYTTSGIWEFDSEFDPAQSDWTTQTVKRSAAILLNLDCSSSLGTEFPKLQAAAKSFVSLLYENSIDPNAVASISLNKSTLTMVTGNVETLIATVLPTTALDTRVEWSSTNAAVATVSNNGVVTAVGPGNATIIAKTVDGGLTATCKVSVVTLAQEITFDCTELEIYNGESYTLQATVLPEDTSNKSLSWASSNTAVATVDDNGVISPIQAGTTTITATTQDGSGVEASCLVTILQQVTSIALNYTSAQLEVEDTFNLTATISPSNASNKNVSWSSSDNTIVSVDQNGLCTALQIGTAVIKAESVDGASSATCSITVSPINYELRKIYYTSTDGQVVEPANKSVFGATVISNYYENGQGVILFDGKVTKIGNQAFKDVVGLVSITIPSAVMTIGEHAFRGISSLQVIHIPSSVTSIGNYAFAQCDQLEDITIPKNITEISAYLFWQCEKLTSITIPSGVTTIRNHAFYECSNLTTIYCQPIQPPRIRTDLHYATWETFSGNAPNRKIYVPSSEDHSIIYAYKTTSYWDDYADAYVEYDFSTAE